MSSGSLDIIYDIVIDELKIAADEEAKQSQAQEAA
jgi:hypothetical protein